MNREVAMATFFATILRTGLRKALQCSVSSRPTPCYCGRWLRRESGIRIAGVAIRSRQSLKSPQKSISCPIFKEGYKPLGGRVRCHQMIPIICYRYFDARPRTRHPANSDLDWCWMDSHCRNLIRNSGRSRTQSGNLSSARAH